MPDNFISLINSILVLMLSLILIYLAGGLKHEFCCPFHVWDNPSR